MAVLLYILRWINKITLISCEKISKQIDIKKLYKKIKKSGENCIQIEGKNGFVVLFKNELTTDSIVKSIKEIIIVPNSKNFDLSSTITDNNRGGFVVKEIKFDNYMSRDDLVDLINKKSLEIAESEKKQEIEDSNQQFNKPASFYRYNKK